MKRSSKRRLPFDQRGGVVALPRHLLSSPQYLSLSAQAKTLMLLMHIHWRNDRPVAYGVKEAAAKIPCDRRTAMKAFKDLERLGFITCIDEFWFCSRIESKSRTWRLEWLPYMDNPPKNTWELLAAS